MFSAFVAEQERVGKHSAELALCGRHDRHSWSEFILSADELANCRPQFQGEIGAIKREGDIGAQKAEFRSAIVGLTVEAHAVKGLGRGKLDHTVRDLDFVARALLEAFEDVEDFRLQD